MAPSKRSQRWQVFRSPPPNRGSFAPEPCCAVLCVKITALNRVGRNSTKLLNSNWESGFHRDQQVPAFRKLPQSACWAISYRAGTEDVTHARPDLRRDLEDLYSRAHAFDISSNRSRVEFCGLGHIHLGNDRDVGAIEDSLIFQRLIFAFGGGEENETKLSPRS
jgi:hypothetical protein